MWELDYKENWALKNWYFWTVALEKTLESLLDCREIQPVNPKGNQSWTFIGRTDVEAEAPILWPPDAKNWLLGKDPDAWKDWRQDEKGMTEDEMVVWHHWLNEHEFEQAPGVGDGQGSLACCSPWGCKELDMTKRLNWAELTYEEIVSPDVGPGVGITQGSAWASLVVQMTKNLPAVWETWARSLDWEDLLEEDMATQCSSNILPRRPHGQWSLAGYSPWGHKESDTTEQWSTVHRAGIRLSYFLSMWQISLWSEWSKPSSTEQDALMDSHNCPNCINGTCKKHQKG